VSNQLSDIQIRQTLETCGIALFCYEFGGLSSQRFWWNPNVKQTKWHFTYLILTYYSIAKTIDAIWYDMIGYIFNCNWVDTRWQQYSTHLHTNSTQKTETGTYITTNNLGSSITINKFKTNLGSAGRDPSLRVIPWHLPCNWGKSTDKTSVRVAIQ
jgi:hypothetical protein